MKYIFLVLVFLLSALISDIEIR